MAVLFVLFGGLVAFRLIGLAGVASFADWLACGRAALAGMFLFTALAHFTPMRKDLIAMVPPAFPRPDLLVALTGFAEIAGALGLLYPPTRLWAACGLMALLGAMLPANISAARRGLRLRGQAATPLVIRIPMQLLFIGWTWVVR
jgi:uncharacterized membrane protein